MECAQLRRDDLASAINLSDYPLTASQLRVLSRRLMFTPIPPSVDRLSLRESIPKFERSLRHEKCLHETNNSDYDNGNNKFVLCFPGLPFPTVTNF